MCCGWFPCNTASYYSESSFGVFRRNNKRHKNFKSKSIKKNSKHRVYTKGRKKEKETHTHTHTQTSIYSVPINEREIGVTVAILYNVTHCRLIYFYQHSKKSKTLSLGRERGGRINRRQHYAKLYRSKSSFTRV
jgi:hypothetical protein